MVYAPLTDFYLCLLLLLQLLRRPNDIALGLRDGPIVRLLTVLIIKRTYNSH